MCILYCIGIMCWLMGSFMNTFSIFLLVSLKTFTFFSGYPSRLLNNDKKTAVQKLFRHVVATHIYYTPNAVT